MKLVTKMRKFVNKMEKVESMSERQLVQMLFRAQEMMNEYIATEERKEIAYASLKQATKYKSNKTSNVSQETSTNIMDEVMDEVAVTIEFNTTQEEEQILDNGGYITMNEDVLSRLNFPGFNVSHEILNNTQHNAQHSTQQETIINTQTKLVITKENEEKGLLIGAYHKDGAVTYFSSSNSFDNPVVFGNPALTKEIKDSIVSQKPNFYQPVTKNFKSIALFGKVDNKQAMVYLADAKRLVFEGYIGDMIFSTTKEYLDADYNPLVTRADIFINNGGKHNHVTENMCTKALKKFIVSLIEQYMVSPKFNKAKNDIEYFNRLRKAKAQTKTIIEPTIMPESYVPSFGSSGSFGSSMTTITTSYNDSYVCNFGGVSQQQPIIVGGDDYEPEF